MHKLKPLAAAFALLLAAPLPALANPELEKLRAEFEQKLRALQDSYETRLKQLEGQMVQTESKAQAAQTSADAAARAPAAASAFNPEISLILQGRYHHAKGDGHITGFLPAGHGHGGGKGLSLDGTELTMGASIDPYFRGFANFVIADGAIEIEEAWAQTTALGHGFILKGGRYLSGIGYTNELHPHFWDFANQNLAYAAMIGAHYVQDGLQLRWLAPTPMFLQFGAEVGQGADWRNRNRPGSYALFAHVGDDVGTSHSWRAGLSRLHARADHREGHWDDVNGVEAQTDFTGRSRYWIADLVWKWAPHGNPKYQNFKFQAEYLRRSENGNLACEDNTADGGACTGLTATHTSKQSGFYAQGIYQFMPRWRTGYRYDRLNVGTVNFGPAFAGVLEAANHKPTRHSLMLDYSPSEFSRFRLQLARDRAEQGLSDNQVTLQYIHSLGPHGAHKF